MDEVNSIVRSRRLGRRLVIAVALIAFFAACLWGRSQLEWVNDRQDVIDSFHANDSHDDQLIAISYEHVPPKEGPVIAPWTVRALKGTGVGLIWIDGRAPESEKSQKLSRLRALFPEATVTEAPENALHIYDAEVERARRP